MVVLLPAVHPDLVEHLCQRMLEAVEGFQAVADRLAMMMITTMIAEGDEATVTITKMAATTTTSLHQVEIVVATAIIVILKTIVEKILFEKEI